MASTNVTIQCRIPRETRMRIFWAEQATRARWLWAVNKLLANLRWQYRIGNGEWREGGVMHGRIDGPS